jgi:hypothetical protein
MTPRRALALSLAIAAASATAASAQTLSPDNAPPLQPLIMPTPGAPTVAPDTEACMRQLTAHREEVEKLAAVTVAGSQTHVSREELCKLVQAYSNAEANWIKYTEDNMIECAISKDALDRMRAVHVRTLEIHEKICASAPKDLRERTRKREQSWKYQRFARRP